MSYNTDQYNLAGYNVGQEDSERWLAVRITETIKGLFTASRDTFLFATFREQVSCVTSIGRGHFAAAVFSEAVSGRCAMITVHYMRPNFTEIVSAQTKGAFFYWGNLTLSETVDAAAKVESNRWLAQNFTEVVTAVLSGSIQVFPILNIYELVSAICDVQAVDEYTSILNVTLPPGGKLIIDADNYNVLLNGENAIHLHSGDWLNAMNRMTQNIRVQSGTGGTFSARILFTERYL